MINRVMCCAAIVLAFTLSGCQSGGANAGPACTGCEKKAAAGDEMVKCTGCGMTMKCGDVTAKCSKCGAEMKCSDVKAAQTSPCCKGDKAACAGGGKSCVAKCPKCGGEIKCDKTCPKCKKPMECVKPAAAGAAK
ncbi:MAG: hypothetical protein HZB38_13020 [Planctomycetes bacterium]|nr:hypothetical protein [Planctomycetota bacterium]